MSEADLPSFREIKRRPRKRRRWKRALAILGGILLVLALLLVSFHPTVEERGPPTAESVHAAREAARQFANRTSRLTTVRLDNKSLAGLASIASEASHIRRLEAWVEDGQFHAGMSLPLPIVGWINAGVDISGDQHGFPALNARVGRVALPNFASRWLADIARLVLRMKGVKLPPLDEAFRRVTVGPEEIVAEVALPTESGLVGGLIGIRGGQADHDAVAALYCKLVDLQTRMPDPSLAAQLRRAFVNAPEGDAVTRNRTALIAVAMLAVGERVSDLAPGDVKPTRKCGVPATLVHLEGRVDLAKHWSLSAALAATLGADTARAMGEWKELDDSMPDGSGFSFVDLAADRSGVHAGRAGTDTATAEKLAQTMSVVTDHQLLPVAALAAQEGLSEQQFLQRYGTIKSGRYQDTVAWIDRILASAD